MPVEFSNINNAFFQSKLNQVKQDGKTDQTEQSFLEKLDKAIGENKAFTWTGMINGQEQTINYKPEAKLETPGNKQDEITTYTDTLNQHNITEGNANSTSNNKIEIKTLKNVDVHYSKKVDPNNEKNSTQTINFSADEINIDENGEEISTTHRNRGEVYLDKDTAKAQVDKLVARGNITQELADKIKASIDDLSDDRVIRQIDIDNDGNVYIGVNRDLTNEGHGREEFVMVDKDGKPIETKDPEEMAHEKGLMNAMQKEIKESKLSAEELLLSKYSQVVKNADDLKFLKEFLSQSKLDINFEYRTNVNGKEQLTQIKNTDDLLALLQKNPDLKLTVYTDSTGKKYMGIIDTKLEIGNKNYYQDIKTEPAKISEKEKGKSNIEIKRWGVIRDADNKKAWLVFRTKDNKLMYLEFNYGNDDKANQDYLNYADVQDKLTSAFGPETANKFMKNYWDGYFIADNRQPRWPSRTEHIPKLNSNALFQNSASNDTDYADFEKAVNTYFNLTERDPKKVIDAFSF